MADRKRVREVVEHIDDTLAARKDVAFHMNHWAAAVDHTTLIRLRPELAGDPDVSCGTSMCFAGWAVDYAELGDLRFGSVSLGAQQYLELTDDETMVFYDDEITDTKLLRAACNYYFHDEIFTLDECGGNVWYMKD